MQTKQKTMKERLYRLEFNEKHQNFHHNNGTHEPETNGYFTIFEHSTDLEIYFYDCYIRRNGQSNFTKEYLLKSASECRSFIRLLLEYDIHITSETFKQTI